MKKIISLLMIFAATLCCFAACSDNEPCADYSAGVFRLSKTAYSATDGMKVTSPWVAYEKSGLLVSGKKENIAGNTINTTEAELLFTFAVPTSDVAENYCLYYPYAESATYADGKMTLDMTTQSGELTQYCASVYNGTSTSLIASAPSVTLSPLFAVIRVNIPASSTTSSHKLAKVSFAGNGGEQTGGIATIDMNTGNVSCTAETTEVSFPTPLDISSSSANVYLAVAPGSYEQGYTVTVTDENGYSNSTAYNSSIELAKGTITPVSGKFGYTELAFVGSTNVYIINADTSVDDNLDVLWHWDSAQSDIPSGYKNMFIHCDDAKSVDDGTKILVTSSATTGGCALIDRATQKCLFYARANNAHSATLLPGDRIIVACSNGSEDRHNSLCLFDMDKPDELKYKAELTSAHGVQWIASRQRLYAIGEDNLMEYSLVDWNTDSPSLKVERTIKTPKNGLHDLTVLSDDELLCAGNNAYSIHLDDLTFTEIPQFHGETSVKSVNYNKDSGVIWATIAEESWWTFHIKEMHIGSSEPVKTLSVPFSKFGTNVYKCRVYQW